MKNSHKPSQLEKKRKEHYRKLYARYPQLVQRLIPLMRKADIIQKNVAPEPNPYSPKDPLSKLLKKSEPKGKKKIDKKKKLREDLNTFSNNMKKRKPQNLDNSNIKNIEEIKPEILWGLLQ